jgi:hypothetical protein
MTARIDDEELMAHLDGELPGIEAGRIARALAEDDALRAEAEGQRRLKERLARRYDAVLEEPVPERLRAMLQLKVVPFPAPAGHPLRLGWPRAAAIAASLALAVVAASFFSERGGVPGTTGEPRAAAALSAALDSQLASAQPGGADTRIGLSFAARDGRLCRTFETGAIAGLACRGGDGWQIVTSAVASGQGGAEYRQAGSGSTLVMERAEQMMVGAPFDAKAEREARDRGWTVR